MAHDRAGDTGSPERTGTWGATRTGTATVTRVVREERGLRGSVAFGVRRGAQVVAAAAGRLWSTLRETLTAAGWLVAGFGVLGLGLALVGGWALGWVLAVATAVLLVLCVPFLLGGHDFAVRLQLDRDRVVAGHEVGAQVRVVNRGRRAALPATIDVPVGDGLVEAHIPLMGPGGEHVERLTIAAHRRGVIDVGPMTLTRSDPIGVLRRQASWPDTQTIFVHPVTTRLPATSSGQVHDLEGLPSSDVVASDLSFHAIREYVHGDSLRHVHWRSTAKTGRLMVREYQESRRSMLAVLLTLALDDFLDDDEVELAVSVAASLAAQGVRDGRDMFVAASQEQQTASRAATVSIVTLPTVGARALLDATCELVATERSTRVEDVATLAAQSCPQMAVAFLVVGSGLDVTRLTAAALALPLGTQVVAIRCEIDGEPRMRTSRELTVLSVGALGDLGRLLARGVVR